MQIGMLGLGRVVSSWLLDAPKLESYTGYVQDSGEGRWTVQTAIEKAVPADVQIIKLAAEMATALPIR